MTLHLSLPITKEANLSLWPTLGLEEIFVADNETLLEELLAQNIERVAEIDSRGKSLPQMLFEQKALRSVGFLLKKYLNKIDLGHCDNSGKTLLHYACLAGDGASVELLLQEGVDPLKEDSDGLLAVHYAIQEQHEKAVDQYTIFLKPALSLLITRLPKSIETLLHHAARKRYPILKAILRLPLDRNRVDQRGRAPLHYAQESETHFQNTFALLHCGAKTNVIDSNGETPLGLACARGNIEAAQLMLDPKYTTDVMLGQSHVVLDVFVQQNQKLIQTIFSNEVNLLQSEDVRLIAACTKALSADLFLDPECAHMAKKVINGVPVFPRTDLQEGKHLAKKAGCPEGNTLLHDYVLDPQSSIKVLGDYTSDAGWKLRNRRGETPFLLACRQGSIVRVLDIQKCNDGIDTQDSMGNSGLHLSILYNSGAHAYFMTFLFGFHLANRANSVGQMPLQLACSRGLNKVVVQLLRKKADVNCVDQDERGALHYLCDAKGISHEAMKEIVAALCECKVDLERPNRLGETPLAYAWKQRNMPLFYELLKRGADPTKIPSLLSQACEREELPAIDALLPLPRVDELHIKYKSHEVLYETIKKIASSVKSGKLALGPYRTLSTLLNRKVDPNPAVMLSDTVKSYSLTLACMENLPRVVAMLFKAGATIADNTLLEISIEKKFSEVAKLLFNAGAQATPRSNPLSPGRESRKGGSLILKPGSVKRFLTPRGGSPSRIEAVTHTLEKSSLGTG